ncbi:Bug family tripartite tricarboxylate transporter substrate binding protein [Muricoccus pecuniae]|uniref:Tripartite-type tricarboxylate transporter receptor subunit TctC n=1 Tax=Muricoccus pecuniae TaxID=693023 RepID=A0A840Y8I8_9PROT|nr:tripartite tricarboxylate transporter substrate binding protein [Roseomonas pecuniae]MBB5696250.1 tripartite-type tricarboxylate transporter receptor subunit TctC [Roseomonas pecuniae]
MKANMTGPVADPGSVQHEEKTAPAGAMQRRTLLAASGTLLASPAIAAFPERPVRIIVPWSPGALLDVVTRAIAQAMSATLGQSVIVENRPGATGAVGAEAVARATPDGSTLVAANAETHAINPLLYRRLPYDAVRDFTPVCLFTRAPFALVAGPSRGFTSLQALIDAAKAKPGAVSFASWGAGSTSRLTMELLLRDRGIEMLHVPFVAQAPAITAVMGGQVDAMFLTAGGGEAAARDGKVKVLAVSSAQRIPLLPQTPTLRESGIPVEGGNWFALMGPARMPAEVARRLAEATAEAMQNPSVLEVCRVQAADPITGTPEELASFIAEDRARWAEVINALKLQLD